VERSGEGGGVEKEKDEAPLRGGINSAMKVRKVENKISGKRNKKKGEDVKLMKYGN